MEKGNEYVEYIFEFKRKDALALLEALYFKTEIPRTFAISSTPLVRCKNCIFWSWNGDKECTGSCVADMRIHNGDWFCANGEPKEVSDGNEMDKNRL